MAMKFYYAISELTTKIHLIYSMTVSP